MIDINYVANEDLEFLSDVVFEYLNGKINPNVKASGIMLENPRLVKCDQKSDTYTYTAGFISGNKVFIFQNNINEVLDKVNGDRDYLPWITGWLIEVIAHELSHLNQDYDMLRYTDDKEYRDFIEITNTLRTFEWLDEHMKELELTFGNLDMKSVKANNYYLNTVEKKYNYTVKDYVPIKGEPEFLLNLISGLMRTDASKLLEESYKRGITNFGIGDTDKEYIYTCGDIKQILSSSSISHTVSTYITEKIIACYKSIGCSWEITENKNCLVLAYKIFDKIPSFDKCTLKIGVYDNRVDKELEFCDKYFKHDICEYNGFVR